MTPMGLGFCPDVMACGETMLGRDNRLWKITMKNGRKIWSLEITDRKLVRELPVLERLDDGQIAEVAVPEEEPKEVLPEPVPKVKAAPKPKAKPKAGTVEGEPDKPPPAPKKRAAAKPKAAKEPATLTATDAAVVPPKVKRPPTAFNIFVREQMAELKILHPTMNGRNLMAMASAAWKTKKTDS